jgi:hypothetical protein
MAMTCVSALQLSHRVKRFLKTLSVKMLPIYPVLKSTKTNVTSTHCVTKTCQAMRRHAYVSCEVTVSYRAWCVRLCSRLVSTTALSKGNAATVMEIG